MKFFDLKNHDWILTITSLVLLLIGLVVIYSATFTAETPLEGLGTINRQLIFVLFGFIVYFIFSSIDTTFFKYPLVQGLMVTIIIGLLVYVWIFGDPIRNTNRWIEWGFIRIQPSEYTKIVLIILNSLFLSKMLESDNENESKDTKERDLLKRVMSEKGSQGSIKRGYLYYLISFVISAICIILILIEPSLGNATITALIVASLYFIAYPDQIRLILYAFIFLLSVNIIANFASLQFIYDLIGFSLIFENIDIGIILFSIFLVSMMVYIFKLRIFRIAIAVFLGLLVSSGVSYAWNNVLKDYQKQRIEVFMNPEDDPQGAGWQLRQAKIAIGSGRLFGKGFLHGSQSKLRYLPEAYSDFIFAAYSEEFGFAGALLLFILYTILIVRILKIAQKAISNYHALLCYGVAFMIIIHVFINIGMNVGVLPVTGIPLPLISYGGSSIMVTMIALGIVQSVNMYRNVVDKEESLMITSNSKD